MIVPSFIDIIETLSLCTFVFHTACYGDEVCQRTPAAGNCEVFIIIITSYTTKHIWSTEDEMFKFKRKVSINFVIQSKSDNSINLRIYQSFHLLFLRRYSLILKSILHADKCCSLSLWTLWWPVHCFHNSARVIVSLLFWSFFMDGSDTL